jgi:hypothetical protein
VAKHEKICPFNPKRLAEHDAPADTLSRQDGERMEMPQMDVGRQAQINGWQMEAVRKDEQPYPELGAGKGAHGVSESEGKDSTRSWSEPFMTRAMHAFTPNIFRGSRDEEILFFNAGDKVLVLDRDECDNWWFGSIDDQRGKRQGWFPTNYVQRI